MSDTKVRIQDDLFEAVNGEWLSTAVIPDDRPTAGGFSDLDQGVEKLMMEEFAALARGEKTTDIPEMQRAVLLYKKAMDTEARNAAGIAPVLPLLAKIKAIRTVEELNDAAADLLMQGVRLPIQMFTENDMKDATTSSFTVQGPEIILPDTSYYEKDNAAGAQLLQVFAEMAARALSFTPLTPREQAQYVSDTLAFDALAAAKVKSRVEWADYVSAYNPMDADDVAAFVAPIDIKRVLKAIYGDRAPDTVIVFDPRAIREMSGYFSEENLELYLHWAYVNALLDRTSRLSEELCSIGTTYRRALTGAAADPSVEKRAYQAASMLYMEPVGVYYARAYFGEEAKKDVTALVKKIIDTYILRMRRNSFLSPSTKEKAIAKLSAIEVKMGYPDAVNPFWSELVFDEDDTYYDAVEKLSCIRRKHDLDRLLKPVDRTEWAMPGHMVNACYSPFQNDITFPAAILQPPFYSVRQSVSENLGGIGAVIGHEISHAFDNNGAKFNEKGNLENWWTDEDFKAFEALTKDMIEQFDGIPFHGGTVNGELVVSENIADNGGMGVTLEIMHTLEDPDYKAYFINWGKVWCIKAKEEYIRLLLASDVHSPGKLRANIPPRNFSEWYEAFDVQPADEMYIAPDKRISIW